MVRPITSTVNFRNTNQQLPVNADGSYYQQQSQSQVPPQDMYVRSDYMRPQPPEIGFLRLATGFITQEQVDQINLSRRLPDNAKFIQNEYGKFVICNNFMGLRVGTQELPMGFEVKLNIIGKAVVLPKGSSGLLVG